MTSIDSWEKKVGRYTFFLVDLARLEMSFLTCPTCQQEFDSALSAAMPFCSERCRLIDLGRWYNEEISMPLTPEEQAERELQARMDQRTERRDEEFEPE